MSIDSNIKDFKQFYNEHESFVRKSLYYIIKNENKVDDIVQEVFVKIWKKSNSFKNKSNIKTWIYRITINSAYDYLRKEKKHITTDEKSVNEPEDLSGKNKLENEQLIKKALSLLTEKQRGPFVLHYIQGLTTLEIAQALDVAEGTIKSRLHTSRDIVTAYLEKQGVII